MVRGSPASDCTFDLFSRLPVELQLKIWRECLPTRIYEVDSPKDFLVFDLEPTALSPCKLWQTTFINGRPPVISRVCRASRAIALETGSFPLFNKDVPNDAEWVSDTSVDSWFDTTRDSVHLNWTSTYKFHYMSMGNPLHFLAWNAARTTHGGSFMAEYLNKYDETPESERLDAFERLPSWMVVDKVVVVHTDPKTGAGTGLFGLLGDARVQLVDVSDQAKLNSYFDLAEECEGKGRVTVKQNFHRNSAELIKQKLRDIIIDTFGSESLLPPMRPVIMFRLCTAMCNHEA